MQAPQGWHPDQLSLSMTGTTLRDQGPPDNPSPQSTLHSASQHLPEERRSSHPAEDADSQQRRVAPCQPARQGALGGSGARLLLRLSEAESRNTSLRLSATGRAASERRQPGGSAEIPPTALASASPDWRRGAARAGSRSRASWLYPADPRPAHVFTVRRVGAGLLGGSAYAVSHVRSRRN